MANLENAFSMKYQNLFDLIQLEMLTTFPLHKPNKLL